ncbi:hypothetical protein OC845_002685 [Tilletia horrida]|nr:hypothetical protein OC845_002685 [Tilletia horrida]
MTGRAEVIQDWADAPEGTTLTFERGRMDKALQEIVTGDRPARLPASLAPHTAASIAAIEGRTAKQVREDVETIVSYHLSIPVPAQHSLKSFLYNRQARELWISSQQAEVLLVAVKGDLSAALQRGVQPPPNWPSK